MADDKKAAVAEQRTLVWVDEAGFRLLPSRMRTYAPCGQTPCLRVPLTHDRLSVISGVTHTGRLFTWVRDTAFDGAGIVRFLRHLLVNIAGAVTVIWDGIGIHRCQAVKQFLAGGAAARLRLERLPNYAPETNADEGVWRYLKRVELRNVCCRTVAELRNHLRLAIMRLRTKRSVLLGFIRHAGYHNDETRSHWGVLAP